jgi:hypothetical protein
MNYNNIKYDDSYFPILISDNILDNDFYQKLKDNYPNYNNYISTSDGQEYRKNIVVTKNNENYNRLKKYNIEYVQLYDIFNSKEFINYCFKYFNKNILTNNNFIGNLDNYIVEMSICESINNYENPFHVDTRKRIIHMLIYFGDDDIIDGGEIAIAKCKHKNNNEYGRYLDKDDILEIKKYPPKDNFGVIILSTPNSYHKGCHTIGKRRFIYLAINNKNNENAWINNKDLFKNISFKDRLNSEK